MPGGRLCATRRRAARPSHVGAHVHVVAAVAGLGWGLTIATGVSAAADPLVEDRAGVVVDWRRGTVAATGGAAADHRMPSADVARPGAERRARIAARVRLAEALRVLPLGAGRHLDESAVSRALGRARSANVEYQSNGGALVRLEIAFGDWVDDQTPSKGAGDSADQAGAATGPTMPAGPVGGAQPVAFLVNECRLAAAPVIVARGQEIVLRGARYLPANAVPPGSRPLSAHSDKKGRLVLADGDRAREFAGRLALIYFQKISQ